MVSALLLAGVAMSCVIATPTASPSPTSPAAQAPSPTPSSATTPAPPTSAPTATTAASPAASDAGVSRYTNAELGFSLELPAGWRRAICSPGVTKTAPLSALERFVDVPESEEVIGMGSRIVSVSVVADEGLTPSSWLERYMLTQPDVRVERTSIDGQSGARLVLVTTGEPLAQAFAGRGWMYVISRPYFGMDDPVPRRILPTFRMLNDATLGRATAPTRVPRSIESVVDAVADGFARKDVVAITGGFTPCVTVGAIPGDAVQQTVAHYRASLAVEFAAGTTVRVQARPIESDPTFGRFVRMTWSKPGAPDQRVDLLLRAEGDRWSVAAVFSRAPGY
jgi:hypothetical protein